MDHSWGYGSERRQRNENQDSYGVFEFPDFTLAVVCDGMGGHIGGAQASSLAVRTIHDALQDADPADIPKALSEAIQAANLAIFEAARKNHRLMGMGTTAVVAAITDELIHVAHVGDSRAYLVRGGTVQHLTRDHTMVNLFVDAELLTPEDAATHPEAHVLSRSLGAERTVDVDVAEPMPIGSDDLILLCSDGVHGVLSDVEIGNTDWGAPHEGVRHLLDIVISRDGDDNASAVAVLTATSFEDVPPTPVPEVKALEESLAANQAPGLTMVPPEVDASPLYVDDEGDPYSDSASAPPTTTAPSDSGVSYVVYDEPAPTPIETPNAPAESAPPPRPVPAKGRKKWVWVLAAGLGAAVVGLGALFLFLASSSTDGPPPASSGVVQVDPPSEADAPPEQAALLTLAGDPSLHTEDDGTPQPEDEPQDPEADPSEEIRLYAPVFPEAPRRLPHRAIRYTHPPPGGAAQWEAVQAARNHECTRALQAVARGMEISVDHAALYSQAWFCYNENHQRPLVEATADTWEDFAFLLPHLEGSPEERRAVTDPDIKNLPTWYQPAVGGIEFRLQSFMSADRTTRLDEVIGDLLGDPTVADHLAIDLWIEATAAVGLSRQVERTDLLVDWWARRVFVLSAALHGRPGRLIEAHRPELTPQLRQMLDVATSPLQLPADEDGKEPEPIPVPAVVLQARQVALGLIDPPTARRVQQSVKPKPVAPLEPELEDLQDFDRPKIHRR